jgi:hypothetical protein
MRAVWSDCAVGVVPQPLFPQHEEDLLPARQQQGGDIQYSLPPVAMLLRRRLGSTAEQGRVPCRHGHAPPALRILENVHHVFVDLLFVC